ncbi:hypothetical protein [Streptomyces sp. ML-6]|uniref:hypothetical protein n=1 Tax=Streptomyces sp. ML-6 TaxID=2982693 RepID=UPI0024BF483D|nr:hypothetical protein [Streptomyces sp. ML-6]MDK0519580.1 hypothetical protein [Streptomyces sp. ML-6]
MTSLNAPSQPGFNGRPVSVPPAKGRGPAVTYWLLSAAPDLREARDQWVSKGIALLRCGVVFAAVRIQADIVQAAAGTKDPERIDAYLKEVLRGGAVFIDTSSQRYYALVPANMSRLPQWAGPVPGVECLGPGCFLGVPSPHRTEPTPSRSYWCVPMDGPGALCAPGAVALLVAYGSHQRSARQRLAVEAKEDGRG